MGEAFECVFSKLNFLENMKNLKKKNEKTSKFICVSLELILFEGFRVSFRLFLPLGNFILSLRFVGFRTAGGLEFKYDITFEKRRKFLKIFLSFNEFLTLKKYFYTK